MHRRTVLIKSAVGVCEPNERTKYSILHFHESMALQTRDPGPEQTRIVSVSRTSRVKGGCERQKWRCTQKEDKRGSQTRGNVCEAVDVLTDRRHDLSRVSARRRKGPGTSDPVNLQNDRLCIDVRVGSTLYRLRPLGYRPRNGQ